MKPDLWGPVSGGLGSGDYRWGRGTDGGMERGQAESSGGHAATKLISKPPPCTVRDHGEGREGCQNLLTSAGHVTTGGPEYPAAADSILDRRWPSQEHATVLLEPQIPRFRLPSSSSRRALSCGALLNSLLLFFNLFCPCSLGHSPGPSGSVPQSVPECVCEVGAGPAVDGLQRSWLHDVKPYR